MKTNRQSKIIEIIQKNEVETQDELSALLEKDGFRVTQATVSRDIRELKLTKIPTAGGRQKYAVITDAPENLSKKYERVLREGFLSIGYGTEYPRYKDCIGNGKRCLCCNRCHEDERNRRFDCRR